MKPLPGMGCLVLMHHVYLAHEPVGAFQCGLPGTYLSSTVEPASVPLGPCPLPAALRWWLQGAAGVAEQVLPALWLAGVQAASSLVGLCVHVTEAPGHVQGCEGTVTRRLRVSRQNG